MTTEQKRELENILKELTSMLYREGGQAWCEQMMDRINKLFQDK